MARKIHAGDEDSVQEIDTNQDGVTDVYVITDNAPQGEPVTPPGPPPLPTGYSGNPFQPQWRSALDDPQHPLHHLRNA